MKEAYTTPELEIVEFACEDVITTSPVIFDLDPNETPLI